MKSLAKVTEEFNSLRNSVWCLVTYYSLASPEISHSDQSYAYSEEKLKTFFKSECPTLWPVSMHKVFIFDSHNLQSRI